MEECAMGLMDRVKEQASQLAQKTQVVAQEVAKEGKARADQIQAKRRADAMFRELGAAVYAERTGRAGTDTADKIERLVRALQEQETQDGLGDTPAGGSQAGEGKEGEGQGADGQPGEPPPPPPFSS
jgi:hypothetical protein